MAQSPTSPPTTEEAFTADRMSVWASFCNFSTVAAAAIVVLLILLAIFLV
jgi:hypothetical protein